METYHKIQTLFKRDMDGSLTGKKGKMIEGEWTTPELEYLANNEWEFTEKVDGTNIRIQITRVEDTFYCEYAGRSDNATLPVPLTGWLEKMFPRVDRPAARTERGWIIGPWMIEYDLTNVILFGEGYGPKIQNGGLYRKDQSFVLFDVKVGNFWLDRKSVNEVADTLGIDAVPVIGRGTLYDAIAMVRGDRMDTRANNRAFVKEGRGLWSIWGDFEAEGIVARPAVPLFNRKGERIITKIKAVDFK